MNRSNQLVNILTTVHLNQLVNILTTVYLNQLVNILPTDHFYSIYDMIYFPKISPILLFLEILSANSLHNESLHRQTTLLTTNLCIASQLFCQQRSASPANNPINCRTELTNRLENGPSRFVISPGVKFCSVVFAWSRNDVNRTNLRAIHQIVMY